MKTSILAVLAASVVISHAVTVKESEKSVSIENELFSFNYNLESGSYDLIDKASSTKVISGARFTVDELGWKERIAPSRKWSEKAVEDASGKGKTLSITQTPNSGYNLEKTLHITVYDGVSHAVLGFSVKNQTVRPARIANIGVVYRAKLFPGQELESVQLLRGGAGAEPNRIQEGLGIDTFNNFLLTGKLKGERKSLVVGGLKYDEFLRRIVIHPKRKHFTVSIEDPIGKLIQSGETYHGKDTVFIDAVTSNPFTSLEAYGMAMREANEANPLVYNFPTLCGWLVSNAEYGEGKPINNSKDLVGQMKLAKDSGILDYTKVAIRLEPDYYCNQNQGDTQQGWWDDEHWAKYGSLTAPYEKFNDWFKAIDELGGIPFTYIQCNMPSKDFSLAHPEWMMGNDVSRIHTEYRHHRPHVKMDYTDPGFKKHTLDMWTRLGKGGLKGIKFDYPEGAWIPTGGFEDENYTTTTAYQEVFKLARQGLGKEALIHERNLGEYGTPRLDVTAGIIDMQRVWGDSSHFEPEMASRIGLRWYKNRSVFGYYPDGKSFKGMDTNTRRTMLSLVGLISGRLELGTSFGAMKPEEQHDLTRLYPILDGTRSFRPVDMLLAGRADPSVYVYQVSDDWSQIILCNNSKEKMTISAPLSGDQANTGSLGHSAEGTYYLYDFWNDKLVAEISGSETFSQELEGEQSLTYSLHKKADHPQFLSTNRHILQGMLDLKNVKWDAATKTYSGTAMVVAAEPFVITLASNGHKAKNAEATHSKAELETVSDTLLKLRLAAEKSGEVDWSISFE